MSYTFENSYYFRPYRGKSSYWLNRNGNGSIAAHQAATLYTATGDPDQRLQIHKVEGGCQLLSDLNRSYGLNIYGRGAGSVCDFFLVSGNESDALIDLLTVDAPNSLYRIKMINHNLYLTPASNAKNAKLTWENASGADNQVWQLCASQSSGGSTSENVLTYPCKTMRITQNYNGPESHYAESHGNPADYPIDDGCDDGGRSYMYCPCDEMEVLRVYTSGTNTIWLKSTRPVTMPCGKDYVIMQVMHVETADLQKYNVGTRFTRGQALFPEGKNGADSYHFHIAMATGTALANNNTGWIINSNNSWVLQTNGRNLKPEEAFYVDRSFTNVVSTGGLTFSYK